MTIILVTGPSRSGKSEWAEQLTERLSAEASQQVVYVATAQIDPVDAEWCDRIQKHKARRPDTWQLKEVPIALADTINQATATNCLLVDSLGTWLANLLDQNNEQWEMTQQTLLQAISKTASEATSATASTIILVAEETGWGVVPAYELGRLFRDRLGSLSRAIGELADDVYLVTSGHALNLSILGEPVNHSST